MSLLTKSSKSIQIQNYLFDNKEMIIEEKNFYFWIIDIEKEKDVNYALDFFKEIFIDSVFLDYEDKYLMFYFREVDFDIGSIINSIIDDFSFNIRIYASSMMDFKKREDFFVIYNLYNKYLNHKSKLYMTNIDLVNEIIKSNIDDIKIIKPIILKKLQDDPQIEILIQAMFKNNLNVTQTASDIYMHRNTVIKKLDYIKKETGFNIQKFFDANIIYWIFKIR